MFITDKINDDWEEDHEYIMMTTTEMFARMEH